MNLPIAEACVQMMEAFWREQVEAAPTRDGFALTLPLMFPDGWQVTVFLATMTPGWVRLSDHGKTLGALIEAGMNLDTKHSNTAALLDERVKTFELHSASTTASFSRRWSMTRRTKAGTTLLCASATKCVTAFVATTKRSRSTRRSLSPGCRAGLCPPRARQ